MATLAEPSLAVATPAACAPAGGTFPANSSWEGRLSLRFEQQQGRTILARARHKGPLRVQRPFYEAGGGCQVYLLNPPGGAVGGDSLTVTAELGPGARALLTAPGAAKFYRSDGRLAQTAQHLRVAEGAHLAWLPQETIVYSGAQARTETVVDLARGASFVGWEAVCLGRPAAGETFDAGEFNQRYEVVVGGVPLLRERARIAGGHDCLRASWGFQGRAAYGTFLAYPLPPGGVQLAKGLLAAGVTERMLAGASELGHPGGSSGLVARALGDSAGNIRLLFSKLWIALCQLEGGAAPEVPRIWAT